MMDATEEAPPTTSVTFLAFATDVSESVTAVKPARANLDLRVSFI